MTGKSISMPDPVPGKITRIMVIRWKLGTATAKEAEMVEAWLNGPASWEEYEKATRKE